MLLCLSKTTGGPTKVLHDQKQGRSKDWQGWHTEIINKRTKEGRNNGRASRGGCQGQTPRDPDSHGIRRKVIKLDGLI